MPDRLRIRAAVSDQASHGPLCATYSGLSEAIELFTAAKPSTQDFGSNRHPVELATRERPATAQQAVRRDAFA
jgi:hypothetical protein